MSDVSGIMSRELKCISPNETVSKAAKIMKTANTGSLFVGKGKQPDGIFTERDIARRVVAEGLDPKKTKVSAVMTKNLVCIDATASLSEVFDCMARGQFRHLPIREKGDVIGIISLTDLSRVMRELAADKTFLQSFGNEIKGEEPETPKEPAAS